MSGTDESEVACPDEECDGVLVMLSTHEKQILIRLDATGWAIRSVPTDHRIRIGCMECGSIVVRSDAAESSPEALSVVLGMMKSAKLVAYEGEPSNA